MSTLLKAGLHRTVRVEDPAGNGARVVKRFERGGPLGWVRDRHNARREFQLLATLSERGLPVPRPLGLQRVGSGFEVAMERVEGTALLDLCARLGSSQSTELAHALGALLARMQAAGLEHPDIHARNVLVRPGGELVAIDFHAARLRPTKEHGLPSSWRRDLVLATSGLRDVTTRAFRARAFAAWRAALADPPSEPRALARSIEIAARLHRRAIVDKRRRRWTRVGTACRALNIAGIEGFVDRALPSNDAERLPGALQQRADVPLSTGVAHIVRANRRRAKSVIENAARLAEHGVRAARPCALGRRPESWVALVLPHASRPIANNTPGVKERRRLDAQLADRGLALGAEPTWWRDPEGQLVLGAVDRLAACAELPR